MDGRPKGTVTFLFTDVEASTRLTVEGWPTKQPVTVRMGLYTGETSEREGEYFGSA